MEKLIRADELARILDLNKQQLWILAREKTIPSYRVGRALRFDLQEVLDQLREDTSN